jgi:hypothetical protein
MKKRFICFYLILLLVLPLGRSAAAAAPSAVVSEQQLVADGKTVACEKYNIDGSNYFKLRDIACILNGTGSQFSVGWDAAANTVTIDTGKTYMPDGSELLASAPGFESSAVLSGQLIMIDGYKVSDIPAVNIGGNNFFKLRDLGGALGFGVDYDTTANMIIITSSKVVHVSTAAELLNAIAPNTKITLASGTYDLSSVNFTAVKNDHILWETVYDGTEIIITGVKNCIIAGTDAALTNLVVKPRYADVLSFSDCSGIKINKLTVGHTPEQGYCTGGVLNFSSSETIAVNSCVLYGCGTYGITMEDVRGLAVRDTEIKDCSNGIIVGLNSSAVLFDNCRFHDCYGYLPISLDTCKNIAFKNCMIESNSGWDYFISISICDNISFTDCTFTKNSADYFIQLFNSNAVSFTGNTIENNSFPKGILTESSDTTVTFTPPLD